MIADGPTLYIFSGLPGSGKTTLAQLAYRIAADNLRLGMSVIADSCNPIALTRREWEQVALEARARHINIEVICSDTHEHRRRVETRMCTVPAMKLPTWNEVKNREYHDWTVDRIVVDTSRSVADCIDELLSELSRMEAHPCGQP